jgi:hypothetical protein
MVRPVPNRQQIHEALRDLALITVPVVGACLIYILWPSRSTLIAGRDTIQSSASAEAALIPKAGAAIDGMTGVETRLQGTLDFVNRPCNTYAAGTHLLQKDGTLCVLAMTSTRIGDIAVLSAQQVQQSGQLITAAKDNMNQVGKKVGEAVDAFGGTAKSATRMIDTGTDYFQKQQPQFDLLLTHFDEVTVSGNGSITRFNTLMDSQNTARTSQGIADLMVNSARFMLTADQVEEKLAKCTLHPTIGCVAKSYAILGAQMYGYASPGIPK